MDAMNGVAGGSGPSHDPGMEARVAVLAEIAAATKQGMSDLRQEVHETNRRVDAVRDRVDAVRDRVDAVRELVERDFRLLFGALITASLGLAALMAKGFHWF